jgi:hypothetical protein
MKKPRPDSLLKNLPEDQFAELVDWMLSGVPYRVIKARLLEKFQVEVKSDATLSDFWASCCSDVLLKRRLSAVSVANDLADEAAKAPGRFDQATIQLLQQKAFELAANPLANPRDVKALYMLVLKSRDQDIDKASLDLQRKRFQRETCELFLTWFEDKRAVEIAGAKDLDADQRTNQLGQLIFKEDW